MDIRSLVISIRDNLIGEWIDLPSKKIVVYSLYEYQGKINLNFIDLNLLTIISFIL